MSPESSGFWSHPAPGETNFFVVPLPLRPRGGTPASGEHLGFRSGVETSLQLSLAFTLLLVFPPRHCRHLLLLSPRLEKTGGGDAGGATWGEQGWCESSNHRAPWLVMLAGVCQPAARYSASLALKNK